MLIIDDLAKMILEGLADYTNRAYLTSLQDYLRGIRLLYEREEIAEEEFRRLESQVAEAIKNLRSLQKAPPRRTLDINIF